MNKTDQLFIRARKSREPMTRVKSVYRRFYLAGKPEWIDLTRALTEIVESYLDYPISRLMSDMHPDNHWKTGLPKDADYWAICCKLLISKIRLSEVYKFKGLTKPARYKNENNK